MGNQIQDGTGTGYLAKVDTSNRLEVHSNARLASATNSIEDAESYEFTGGAFLTLANDANEHAIFYLKNTHTTKSMLIQSVRTCGTAATKWIMYKNDTGGTLISDANAGVEVNHNFASSNAAVADVWQASAASKTRSGGEWMSQHINAMGHSVTQFDGGLILGTGDSLTFTSQNVTAVASTDVCVRIHAYYEEI